MRKILLVILFLAPSITQSQQERWGYISGTNWRWDTATVKLEKGLIKVWYEAAPSTEQIEFLSRTDPLANTYVNGRFGVKINCKSSQYSYFYIGWVNNSGVTNGGHMNLENLEDITPESNMEGLKNDVCTYLKKLK